MKRLISHHPAKSSTSLGAPRPTFSRKQGNLRFFVEEIERRSMDNPRQIKVLRFASKMAENIICIGGQPGAGKPRTLVNLIIGLAKIGHKFSARPPRTMRSIPS